MSLAEKSYPYLNNFFHAYLMQDFDFIGDSVEEIIDHYKKCLTDKEPQTVIREIDTLLNTYTDNLEENFYKLFGHGFAPDLWGYQNVAAFFEHLKILLSE
ncbi:contact-dependent growth inhibition system immunity protein [Neisseriaceae bacterium TC5R-5]|nr:contact-dependent growth inhibition system immunity protein [Neisseriaceae bacterium TC5R-5]